MATGEQNGPQPVKSAMRTLEILEIVAGSADPPSLGDLARALGIPKSSLFAILRTMEQRDWVQRDVSGHRYRLGLRAMSVAAAFARNDDIVSLSEPLLDRLLAELQETVHLGRLDGVDIVYLAKRESPQLLRMFSAVGRRLPAYTTALGKSLLAELPEGELDAHLPQQLIAYTPATITDRHELHRELAATRERGYALDNEENSQGIGCVAVALPTSSPPTDAISCSAPILRLGPDRRELVIERLLAAREEIARMRSPMVTGIGSPKSTPGAS